MFYTYDLSFDRTSSLSHNLALAAASSEAPAASTRSNGAILPLQAISPQIICGQVTGRPFSLEFSQEFGGGPGYVLVTVNKLLRAAEAQIGFLLEPPTHFHLNSQTAPAVSTQVARLSSRRLAAEFLGIISAEAVRVAFVRPWHVVVAAKTSASYSVRLLVRKLLQVAYVGGLFSSEFSSDFSTGFAAFGSPQLAKVVAAYGLSLRASSVEALLNLFKVATLLRAASSGRAQTLRGSSGKIFSVGSGSSVFLFRSFGRALVLASNEVARVFRGIPWRVALTSGEAPRLSFGGGNLFTRAFGAIFGQAPALRRGQAVLHGLTGANVAGVGRAPGKIAAGAEAAAVGLAKQPGVLRGAANSQVVLLKRGLGLLKVVVEASRQGLLTAASHIGAAYATVSAQAAALFTQHVIGRSLSISLTQSAIMSLSALRTLLRSIGAASPQIIAVARGMAKSMAVLAAAAQALARSTTKLVRTGSIGIASVLTLASHFFLGAVTSPEVVAQRASHSSLRGVGSTEVVAVALRRGAFLSAISANVAGAARRGLTKLIQLVQGQSLSVANAVRTAFTLISPSAASATKRASTSPAAVSPEHSSAITRYGSTLGTVISAQVSTLGRLTNKLLLALGPQVASGGRGGRSVFRVISSNIATALRPRGLLARASQNQTAANVVYYHFFVAPWAYQQTSLLPPFGGPAEPPSFGPIDPSDQTIFGFDWTSRAYPNDSILSAVVTCVPPGLPFLPGSVYINGTLVEVTVSPMAEPVLPTIFSLRCTATFSSGRVSSFSIPVPVRVL